MLYGASDFDGREVWFIKKILRILVIKEQINEINSKVFHDAITVSNGVSKLKYMFQ